MYRKYLEAKVTDIEIANSIKLKKINDVAKDFGISNDDLISYGDYKAKVNIKNFTDDKIKNNSKVILVSAMNPTPYGEGKTTVTIGLGDALNKLGKKTTICLREPSLGPVFGVKGGATGAGKASIVPENEINMHFTGDIHAITAANNLIAAMLDNSLQQGNPLRTLYDCLNQKLYKELSLLQFCHTLDFFLLMYLVYFFVLHLAFNQ